MCGSADESFSRESISNEYVWVKDIRSNVNFERGLLMYMCFEKSCVMISFSVYAMKIQWNKYCYDI